MFFDSLDDFIAMAGFLAQQQQDDQLQVSRREHLRGAHTRAASTESAAERATEKAASAATAKVPVAISSGEKMIYGSKHRGYSYSQNISYDISKVKNLQRLPRTAFARSGVTAETSSSLPVAYGLRNARSE
jgi:hypothetical protein